MNDALFQSAVRLHRAGQLADAATAYTKVLAAQPQHFQALYFLGFIRMQQGALEEADALIGQAIAVDPSSADAFYNHGCVLQQLKRDAEAVASFTRAIALKPDYTEAQFNRGASLLKLSRFAEALADCDAALARTPADAQAWHNRGDALDGLRRHAEAVQSYSRALALAPNVVKTLSRRADAFQTLRMYEEAAVDYAAVLNLDPDFEYALGNMIYARLHSCDWSSLEALRTQVADGLAQGRNVISPFQHIILFGSAEEQRRCSEVWTAAQCPSAPEPIWRGETYRHEKIRIAYLSKDFRTHAVSLLMAGVIEAHDREAFEVLGISFGPDDDTPMRRRLKRAFDRFVDVDAMSDREAALLLKENEVDIAVDLMGFTAGFRAGIFAHRPAAVQVNFLGFAGTTAAPYMDYILADRVAIPEGLFSGFSEKVVHLPDTFQPNDSQRRAAERRPTRAEEGLPEDAFVFCSFNNSCKILPEMFDIWMRLLRQVPGAVLWLPQYFPAQARNLRREAAARGVSADRIVFAPFVPTPEDYLARLPLADLFLDTLPYNAHTTASDALWMGLPVLTCLGSCFAARVAASLLNAIGLPELVTTSVADYEAAALHFARNPAKVAALRQRLLQNRETSPLFDTSRFCRHLEAAYRTMWERAERGEAPAPFAVPRL